MEQKKPRAPRTPSSEKKPPARRRKPAEPSSQAIFRHGDVVHALNAGQIHLLHTLAQEFPGELQGTLEPAAELVLETAKPGLGDFFLYQLGRLQAEQQRLEALLKQDA